MVYIISEVSSFTHSKLTEGVENLKIRPLDPDHACLGYFIICEMGHAKIYPCTKFEFEVSSFTCSKDMVAVPMQLLDARGGVPKLTRGSLSFCIRRRPLDVRKPSSSSTLTKPSYCGSDRDTVFTSTTFSARTTSWS